MSKKNINTSKSTTSNKEYKFTCPDCGGEELTFVYSASVYDKVHTITKDSAGRPVFKSSPEPHPPVAIVSGELERCFCSKCGKTWYDQFDVPLLRKCTEMPLKPKNK